jgi:ABC-type uncharacterized transport system substrate-binding protein
VDVIFTAGTGIDAAKQGTQVIPIVFALSNDPVGSGLVASLSRPGGNVTGLSTQLTDVAGKRVELMRTLIPGLRRHVPNLFRRAGDFVDRVLRGTKPAEIPIEQPTKFDLVINVTTAKAVGVAVPDNLLALADDAIE